MSAMDFARAQLTSSPALTDALARLEHHITSSSSSSSSDGSSGGGGGRDECNASTPQPQLGMHCSLASSKSIGVQSPLASAELCRQHCCATAACSCWTWTSYEHIDATPCAHGQPCCWLKASAAPLVAATNCSGGRIRSRPLPPPSPPLTRKHACVHAAKAWFFTNTLTLAMGTAIGRSEACRHMPITTALQQSNTFGAVWAGRGNVSTFPMQLLANDSSVTMTLSSPLSTADKAGGQLGRPTRMSVDQQGDLPWVWHDGLVYAVLLTDDTISRHFAAAASLTVSNQVRVGSEFAITQGNNSTLRGPVFSVVLNHGNSVVPLSSYAYAVFPSPTPEQVAELLTKLIWQGITVLSNTKPLQAVCTRGSGNALLQLVFWPHNASTSSARLDSPAEALLPPSATPMVVAGATAGCWDITLPYAASLASAHGLLLQIRQQQVEDTGAAPGESELIISAAAPALPSDVTKAMPLDSTQVVKVQVGRLRLVGAGCVPLGGRANATMITIVVNRSGATNIVRCRSSPSAFN